MAQGVYYADVCSLCKAELAPVRIASGSARWDRTIDLEDHEADIRQPWNADGSVNVNFARMYPKQAAAAGITPEQLRKASR